MKLLPKIIFTTLVPVGAVSSAGVLLLVNHPRPTYAIAWLIISITIVVALTASLVLRSILLRPMERLMQAHIALQHGDSRIRVRIDGNDEIAMLGESFNHMASALQSTEQQFRTIFEAFPAPILLSRLADGRFIDANPVFCKSIGVAREKLIGRTLSDIGYSTMGDDWSNPERFQELVSSGRLDKIISQTRDARGRQHWTLHSTRIIEIAGEKAALTLTIDLTRQKQAEEALRRSNEELQRQKAMSDAIVRAQSDFIRDPDSQHAFDAVLENLLALTGSEYGFIGEVLYRADKKPYLRTYAITNIAWDDDTRRFYDENAPKGMEFYNLDSLFGAVMTSREAVIANDPATDPRRAGMPPGHPPMHAFLGLPILLGDHLIAMIGIANREGGYDQSLVEWLQPMLMTIGHLVESWRAKKALVTSEALFRTVFEAFPSSIALHRVDDGRFIDLNPAFCSIYGLRREHLIGRTFREAGLSADPDGEDAYTRLLQTAGSLEAIELPVKNASGDIRWVLFSTRTIELNSELVALSVAIDITTQKDAERALRESNAHLQQTMTMVEHSNDAMLLCDTDGTFLDGNTAALNIFRCTRSEFIGLHPVVFSPELQPDGTMSAPRSRALIAATLAGQPQRFRWQHCRRDGSLFMAEVALSCIAGDDLHQSRLVGVLRDVTEQDRASKALLESEQRFRGIFEAFPHPIALTDLATSRYIDANPAFYRLLNLPEGQAVGRTPVDLGIDLAPPGALKQALLLRNGRIDQEVSYVHHLDGKPRWIMYSLRSIELAGQPAAMSVSFDFTRQKEVELELQQLNASLEQRVAERTRALSEALDTLTRAQAELVNADKLAALGSLVAGIAHELNTPIGNAVMMASTLSDLEREFAQTMAVGLTRSALQNFVATVQEGSDILLRNLRRAAELITGFKQVAVDQSSYQRRHFALEEVVQEIALTLTPSLRQNGVTLNIDIPASLALDSYPGPLGQVLMNLINNCVLHAFGEGNPGTIVIEAHSLAPDRVGITVTDNGCGMPADVQNRIFEPFFTTRLGQGGSGLGLHITYNLVAGLLGGSIRVHSNVSSGTRFSLELPVTAPLTLPIELA